MGKLLTLKRLPIDVSSVCFEADMLSIVSVFVFVFVSRFTKIYWNEKKKLWKNPGKIEKSKKRKRKRKNKQKELQILTLQLQHKQK